jgi:hypothetical protein
MPDRNQDTSCAVGAFSAQRCWSDYHSSRLQQQEQRGHSGRRAKLAPLCILETDGNANSCRALAIQANAQSYQIGCQSAEQKDAIMLTVPISINDKSARLTSASLMANTENIKQAPEGVAACAKFWGSR